MWASKSSAELLDYALYEVQKAIFTSIDEVKIVLDSNFSGNFSKMWEFCDRLEIKAITELLREEFNTYEIKSEVDKGGITSVVTFEEGQCIFSFSLVWKLTLKKKF